MTSIKLENHYLMSKFEDFEHDLFAYGVTGILLLILMLAGIYTAHRPDLGVVGISWLSINVVTGIQFTKSVTRHISELLEICGDKHYSMLHHWYVLVRTDSFLKILIIIAFYPIYALTLLSRLDKLKKYLN